MSYDSLFTIANSFAFIGWLILLLFPYRPFTNKLLIGVMVALLCVAYAVLAYQVFTPADFSSFSTLTGVIALLGKPGAALAGWIHYLAFDLMTGMFIANNASRHGISYAWVLPCLVLTFLFGPAGLLLYLLLRWALTHYYFADNF